MSPTKGFVGAELSILTVPSRSVMCVLACSLSSAIFYNVVLVLVDIVVLVEVVVDVEVVVMLVDVDVVLLVEVVMDVEVEIPKVIPDQ